jgi:hypothetical protein
VHAIGETVWAQLPGIPSVEPDPQMVWDGNDKAPCIQLSVIATDSLIDLAVLRTVGTKGMGLSTSWPQFTLPKGLDTIGYSGNYNLNLILINRLHGKDVSDVSAAYSAAKAILPKWKLTVTRGKILSTCKMLGTQVTRGGIFWVKQT